MWIQGLAYIRKSAPLVIVIGFCLAIPYAGFSEEPIPQSGPVEKPETSMERKNILNFRAYRPKDSIFKSPSFDLQSPAAPVPSAPAPHTSKKERELRDQERNWIFVLPGDRSKAGAADDILGVEETFGDGSSKSVVTKFLENRPATHTKTVGPEVSGFDKDASPVFGLGSQKQSGFGALSQPGAWPETLFGNNPAPLSLAARWEELHGPNAQKMREDKRIRMNEFESLFGSQSTLTGNGGVLQNSLNLPSATTPLGQPDSFNRNLPKTTGAFRNPAGPISGANAALPNVNARVFGSPSSPSVAPEPVRPVQRPTVLPIPKRRL